MGRATKLRITKRARDTLRQLDYLLHEAYGAPEHLLGNKSDPLDEAIYIILSFQTDLDRFKFTWRQLREAFPRWEDLARAPLAHIKEVLRAGGLQEQKARTIKMLLQAVKSQSGSYSLDFLYDIEDAEAERVLTRLPGLSWKGARCVLLYSLDRPVFPVDGNTFRILKRVGVLSLNAVYRRRSLHDGLQEAVETTSRKRFHINLVIHGQWMCLPRTPHCCECAARSICSMRGVARELRTAVRQNLDAAGIGNATGEAESDAGAI